MPADIIGPQGSGKPNKKEQNIHALRHEVLGSLEPYTSTSKTSRGTGINPFKLYKAEEERKDFWRGMKDHLTKKRISSFNVDSIQYDPGTVLSTILDPNKSDHDVAKIARAYNHATPWLNSRTQFAGTTGALNKAYHYARSQGLTQALIALPYIQQLDNNSQNIVLSVLADPKAFFKQLNYDDTAASNFAAAYMEQGKGTYAEGLQAYDDKLTVKGVTIDEMNQAFASLQDVVPGLSLGPQLDEISRETTGESFHFDPSMPESVDLAAGFRELFGMGMKGYFNIDLGNTTGFEELAAHPGKFWQGAGRVANLALELPSLPIGAVIMTATKIGQAIPGAAKGEEAFDTTVEVASGVAGKPFEIMDTAVRKVTEPLVQTFMDEDDPNYQSAVNAITAAAEIMALKKVGEFEKARQLGKTFIEEKAGLAELGIETPLTKGEYGGSLLSKVPGAAGDILNSPLLHPSRFLDAVVKKWGFDSSFKPVEEAVKKNPITVALFDKVQWVKDNIDPKQQLGYLADHYGERMPVDLIQRLLDSPRAEMGTQFIEHLRANGERVKTLEDLKGQIEYLKKELDAKPTLPKDLDDAVGARVDKTVDELEKQSGESFGEHMDTPEYQRDVADDVAGARVLDEHTRVSTTTDAHGRTDTYYYVDENGKVLATTTETWNKAGGYEGAQTNVAKSARGQHIARDLTKSRFRELGIDTPEKFREYLEKQSLSEAGAGLLRSVAKDLFSEKKPQHELDAMNLERFSLERQKSELMAEHWETPLFEYPKATRYHATVFAPITRSERFWNRLSKPISRVTQGFADDMAQFPRIFNPTSTDRPLDWAESNAKNLNNWLRRAGMEDSEIHAIVGEMVGLEGKTPGDFYTWARSVSDRLNKALPEDTPADLRIALTRWWDSPYEAKPYARMESHTVRSDGSTGYDGEFVVGRTDPRDPSGTHIPLPSRPSEFLGHFDLPDVDLAIDATSWMRRTARKNKAFAVPYQAMRTTMRLATALWKAPILALRIPAVGTRIQIEQAIRARQYGGYKGVTLMPGGTPFTGFMMDTFIGKLGGEFADRLRPSDTAKFTSAGEVDLGSLYGQLIGTHDSEYSTWEKTAQYTLGTSTPKGNVFTGWAHGVEQIHNDWFDRTFVQEGLNVARMLERIENGDFKSYIDQMQLPVLRDAWGSGLSDRELLTRWLDRKKHAIEDITKNDPELLQFIASGRAGGHGKVVEEKFLADGKPIQERVTDLEKQIAATRDGLQRIHNNRGTLTPELGQARSVLQEELRNLKMQMSELEATYPEAFKNRAGLRMGDTKALRNYLQSRWDKGELQMPTEIRVKRHYNPEESSHTREYFRDVRRAWDETWYSLYRPLSAADIHLTRGSMYYQVAERSMKKLEAMGYTGEKARAFAEMEAAKTVRDLMYDLSARNSMHRAMKDVLWFMPAHQEILNTWLLKIPRQYGSVAGGGALIAGKAYAWFKLMKAVGIIQESDNGDRVLIPGLANLINQGAFGLKLPGVKVPDTIYTNPKGFNLVLANPLPGLSILPSFMIGKAAREYGGTFKDIAKWAQSTGLLFSEDTAGIPRQITAFWEAVTGHKFPGEFLSPQYSQAVYNRSFDSALQYAYADSLNRGDKIPRPEDYVDTTDGLTGEPALSATAEQKYHADLQAYTSRIMSDATEYFRGMSLVGLVGSTIAPSSLYTTSSEKETFNKMWQDILAINPNSQELDEVQRKMLDDFLAEHPGSLAYKTWYSHYTDKPGTAALSTDPGDDKDWFQPFYDGQKEYFTGEDYLRSLQANESYRYYTGLQNTALREISPTLDPAELLRNGWQRQTVMNDHAYQWDRYLSLNRDVEAQYQANRLAWNSEFGTPVKTYESERLSSTLRGFRQLAPFFSTEGGNRTGDYKTIMAQLTSYYTTNGEFGEPKTQAEKDMNQYFSSVFTPWANKVFPLYDKARTLAEAGLDTSAVYDKIKRINNSQTSATIHGSDYPTPEEVIFGNKNEPEQKFARYNWASKPPMWLTDFQLDTLKYPNFKGRDQMLKELGDQDDAYHQVLEDRNVSSGSDYADVLWRWNQQSMAAIAANYGDKGTELWNLQSQSPAVRISSTGFGKGNEEWNWAVDAAAQISERLTAAGLSPAGDGELAMYYKKWLFNDVAEHLKSDPEFRNLMEDLSFALPDKGDDQRLGVPLFEAVFFGQFNPDRISPDLIDSVNVRIG